jgi:hypothetical protein
MLWNIHGEKINAPIAISASGDNTIVASVPQGEIFIHRVMLNPGATVTVTVKCGSRVQRTITLGTTQGYTSDDIVGMDGEAIFKCLPGESFIINLSSATAITGGITYSYKNTN